MKVPTMRIALLAATIAASTAASAHDRQPKVCLVTFESAAARAAQDERDVVGARYMPLATAILLERRTDDVSDIYTFGPDHHSGPGIDFSYDGTGTRHMCKDLAELAEGADWDD